jgi:hypothetical protein
MLARLGNVLYWAGCLLAVPLLIFCVIVFVQGTPNDRPALGFLTLAAVVIWLIGRACKYVLAGK